MSFIRTAKRTLGAALLVGAALSMNACDESPSKKSSSAPERGNEFPRSVASKPSGEKTAITPAAEPPMSAAEPGVVEAEEPTVEPAETTTLPDSYEELMGSGKKLLDEGDQNGAFVRFEKAIEKAPKRAMPHIQAARALIALNNPSEARGYAEMAVELDPQSSFAWNTLGRVELAEGNREAAKTSFERATDENEDNSYAWNNLGYVHLLEDNWQEAAAALENATSGSASTAYMWNNLGLAYEHLDLLVEARAAYRQASELGSDKAAASLERLEGVESIVDIEGATDEGGAQPDLEEPEATIE